MVRVVKIKKFHVATFNPDLLPGAQRIYPICKTRYKNIRMLTAREDWPQEAVTCKKCLAALRNRALVKHPG